MHIYFVRHGETLLNKKKAYYGATDTPLTDLGRRQAKKVGQCLEGIVWTEVYISNKLRTLETALCMNEKWTPGEFTVVEDLCELDFGQWEGLDNKAVQCAFPQAYDQWCQDWLYCAPPLGESFSHFFARVKAAFETIIRQHTTAGHEDKNILICAHNGTLRVIFAVMCGLEPEGVWHFNFEQDAYSLVDFECGNFTVRKINAE